MAQLNPYTPELPLPESRPERILFIFLDGVGIGPPSAESNPLHAQRHGFFPLFQLGAEPESIAVQLPASPHARALLGQHGVLSASLDMPGLPQSATGQASLFTGHNGARLLGHHLLAFPERKLTALVREHNLLLRAQRAGKKAAFLNTYTPRFFELEFPHSVSTLCALSLKKPVFMLEEMRAGYSLFHDLTQEGLRAHYGDEIPVFTPYEGGKWLAGAAARQEVALYEHFLTDHIGHKAKLPLALAHLEKLEDFLAGVLEHLDLSQTLMLICTDHGNFEEARSKGHTHNRVPLSAWGPGAEWLTRSCASLMDVTPALLMLMGAEQEPLPSWS